MITNAAVQRETQQQFVLEPVDLPPLQPEEILVRIAGVGMCHTDLLPRAPEYAAALPLIAGHEGAGVVLDTGRDVSDVTIGDHVVLSYDSCRQCATCTAGRPAYCREFITRNLTGRGVTPGRAAARSGAPVGHRWFGQSSFAEHVIATAANTVAVQPDLPIELMGPLGCGFLTGAGTILRAFAVPSGADVTVFGAGAVGLAAIMAAKVAGAGRIVAVDLHPRRLDLATELGATATIRGDDPSLARAVRTHLSNELGYVVETTGAPGVIDVAIDLTPIGGFCALLGAQSGPVQLGPGRLFGKTLVGVIEGGADPHEFIPVMAQLWREGRFPFDSLIETFPLSQVNEAANASLGGRVVKPVLIPDDFSRTRA